MLGCWLITAQNTCLVAAEDAHVVTTALHLHSVVYKTSDAAITSLWSHHSQARSAGLVTISFSRRGERRLGGVTHPWPPHGLEGGQQPGASSRSVFLLLSHSQVQVPK